MQNKVFFRQNTFNKPISEGRRASTGTQVSTVHCKQSKPFVQPLRQQIGQRHDINPRQTKLRRSRAHGRGSRSHFTASVVNSRAETSTQYRRDHDPPRSQGPQGGVLTQISLAPVRVVITMPMIPCYGVCSTVDGHPLPRRFLTKISSRGMSTTRGDYSFDGFASTQPDSCGRAAAELGYSGPCNFM